MKKAFVVSLLPLACLASAQSITSNATAAYGLSPSVTTNSSSMYSTLGDSFNPFPPVVANPYADYAEDTSDGFREGRSDVYASTDWDNASTGYGFSVNNALYFYLSGYANQDASDDITFSNPDGATEGKYRVVLSFFRTGDVPDISASGYFAGFGMTNVTATGTYVSPEYNFSYDSPISTGLSFSSQASSGTDFISFDSRWRSGSIGMSARLELTDLGGASSFGVSSRSGYGYNVQAVPEPASMLALSVGAVGLLRRRFRKNA